MRPPGAQIIGVNDVDERVELKAKREWGVKVCTCSKISLTCFWMISGASGDARKALLSVSEVIVLKRLEYL